mgnify:CR=1 FL=1
MLFFDTKELLSKIKVLPLLKETNFDMTKKRFMKLVTIDAAMSFQEKEDCIFRGLLKYIGDSLGEYLTVDQVVSLAQTLRRLRNRPAEVEFSEDLCSLVSDVKGKVDFPQIGFEKGTTERGVSKVSKSC